MVSCCSYNMLVRWFRLHRCPYGMRPLFGTHPKMGGRNFRLSWHRLGLVFNSFLYLVTSLNRLATLVFTSSSCLATNCQTLYFCLVTEGGTYQFPVVSHLGRRFRTFSFFLVIFNYRSHLPVTYWRTTSALAWLTQVSWPFRRLSALSYYYFLFFSLLPQKLAINSLYNLDLPYHATVEYSFLVHENNSQQIYTLLLE